MQEAERLDREKKKELRGLATHHRQSRAGAAAASLGGQGEGPGRRGWLSNTAVRGSKGSRGALFENSGDTCGNLPGRPPGCQDRGAEGREAHSQSTARKAQHSTVCKAQRTKRSTAERARSPKPGGGGGIPIPMPGGPGGGGGIRKPCGGPMPAGQRQDGPAGRVLVIGKLAGE